MNTMVDEIFDRGYQAGRAELHNGIDALIRRFASGVAATFDAIRRIQFQAPWSGDFETRR
jgi:hypothetical protein